MSNPKLNLKFGVLALMILLAALSRLMPHPPNFTPVGAMALFGAAYFSRRYLAFVIPFVALWASDLFLNNVVYAKMYPEYYQGFTWFGNTWVYASFALIVVLGFLCLKKVKPLQLIGTSLLASMLFFLLTNFGVWASSLGTIYTKDFTGLMACYGAGLPFFWNTILGDVLYVGALFGSFEFLKSRYPQLAFAK